MLSGVATCIKLHRNSLPDLFIITVLLGVVRALIWGVFIGIEYTCSVMSPSEIAVNLRDEARDIYILCKCGSYPTDVRPNFENGTTVWLVMSITYRLNMLSSFFLRTMAKFVLLSNKHKSYGATAPVSIGKPLF